MPIFVLSGKYSPESMRAISRKRSDEARALIKEHGGEVKATYALLGVVDLLVIIELPDTGRAMQISVALTRLLGVSFTIAPAVTIEEFDHLMSRWE